MQKAVLTSKTSQKVLFRCKNGDFKDFLNDFF